MALKNGKSVVFGSRMETGSKMHLACHMFRMLNDTNQRENGPLFNFQNWIEACEFAG